MEGRVQPVQEIQVPPEPSRIELRTGDEAAAGRVDMVRQGDPPIEDLGGVDPPTTGRDLAGGIDPGAEVRPELLGGRRARELTPDAHDRDRVAWFHR